MSDSDEEDEEDDDDRLREELEDLIDDNPIEDNSDGEDSDRSGNAKRRKRSDDEDELDDRLEDDDYDLIEENLGVKVKRTVNTSILYYGVPLRILRTIDFIFLFKSTETLQALEAYANRRQRW